MRDAEDNLTLHASCVVLNGKAVLIKGASGSGKSALALHLMALGATLVADDRTVVTRKDGKLQASAPASIRGLVEARGVGLLAAEALGSANIALAVDMDHIEDERLPQYRSIDVHGIKIPCLYKIDAAYFPAAVLQYLKAGRRDI